MVTLTLQIFDPKLEVIPQAKQFYCLYVPMLCIIYFIPPQRAPFIFVQFDRGQSQVKILLKVTTHDKDVLKLLAPLQAVQQMCIRSKGNLGFRFVWNSEFIFSSQSADNFSLKDKVTVNNNFILHLCLLM